MGFDPSGAISNLSVQAGEAAAQANQQTLSTGGSGSMSTTFNGTLQGLRAAMGDQAYNQFMEAIAYMIYDDVQSQFDNSLARQKESDAESGGS